MELAKGCFRLGSFMWLSLLLLIALGGYWATRNVDQVADAAAGATGIKDVIADERRAKCAVAKREFQSRWDDAVESGRIDRDAERLETMRAGMKELCKSV